jgi:hypothetical protein
MARGALVVWRGTSIAAERRLVVFEPIIANYKLLVFENQLKAVKKLVSISYLESSEAKR